MQAREIWSKLTGSQDSKELGDLRRDAILEVAIVMFVMAWVIVVASIGYRGQAKGLLVALVLLAGALGGVAFRYRPLPAALLLLIAAGLGAIVFQTWIFPRSGAQFYFPLIVVVSSAFSASGWSVFGIATLVSVACLMIGRLQGAGWLDVDQILSPILLSYLTAFGVWLGTRQIRCAFDWMRVSYARATDLLEQLRDERMHLAQTVKMLEDAYYRITKLNDALLEARAAAEAARQLKAEFAANISHELRTPLYLIIGFSETMANAPETYPGVTWTPTLRGDIEQIYHSSRHLSALIDDILDLSALEVRQLGLVIEEAEVQAVIEEAAAVIADLYRAKHLYLRVEAAPDLPRVFIDATRVRQVLLNLLANAIRFTRAGGVTLRAQALAHEVQVAVADTGIGIAPEDVPKVFEVFGQVDGAANRRVEGTGLGVPLSRRLVELHGGRMWLESQPGVGTTFYFTLPVSADGQGSQIHHLPERGARPASPYRSGQRKVMLAIEPDRLLLRTIRRHLSAYEVMEVKDYEDLPALVDFYQPAAVLVDVSDSGPPRLAKWAAQLPPDLPLITVSMPGSLNSARALGIQNYLIKPISRDQLLEAIASVGQSVRTILIVDDDPRLMGLLSRMLQSSGENYQLLRAFGGQEALALLRQHPVDLLLLDLVMPDMSGLEVLKAKKAEHELARVPVIVISAQAPEDSGPQVGLFVQVTRQQGASLSEILACLKAVMEGLPRREAPAPAVAPALRVVPDDRPVS